MKENGLVVHEPPADALGKWRTVSPKGMEAIAGKAYPKETLDQVIVLLREFREKMRR